MQRTPLSAKGKVLDVVEGAGELDPPLDEDLDGILLARVELVGLDTVKVGVQPGPASPQQS